MAETSRQAVMSRRRACFYPALFCRRVGGSAQQQQQRAPAGRCPSTPRLAASLVARRCQAGALWPALDWRSRGPR